ncbi:TIGR02300 family protein [Roseomonas sp. E05]|uniref:TIGR02300 family protein n=1 Tax=Roseomonas sp. E05 TaxID=3046310 RepID=UPI0024BA80B0|nr:TIGR02300 family protein [Roseomonas sp. E05]MDJ0389264.1 TIGR02300 family protein [Roseomonas sp. E05]
MAKPDLGLKRTCVACGAKFYDLGRQPAVCPKCGTEQPAEQPRLRRAAAPVEEKVKKRPAPEADSDEVDLEDVDTDEALDDAEDLEDAEDDIDADIEVETDREEES